MQRLEAVLKACGGVAGELIIYCSQGWTSKRTQVFLSGCSEIDAQTAHNERQSTRRCCGGGSVKTSDSSCTRAGVRWGEEELSTNTVPETVWVCPSVTEKHQRNGTNDRLCRILALKNTWDYTQVMFSDILI